jgi:hypothetical protein
MRLLAIIPTLFSLLIVDYVSSRGFCDPETGDGEMTRSFMMFHLAPSIGGKYFHSVLDDT